MESGKKTTGLSLFLKQGAAALLFCVSSVLIIAVNKLTLTTYKFPSFQVLGLGQIITIITVLWVARMFHIVSFPGPSLQEFRKIFPLPIFYVFNLILGLGSTQKLNLPMYTVLRRFTLLLVAIGQVLVLGTRETLSVNITLVMMVVGALIAALNDLAFDLMGYIFIFLTNLATAANGIYTKKMMGSDMNKYEIMFYNALLVLFPMLLLAYGTGDMEKAYQYDGWSNPYFLLNFFLSCVMAFILIYSTIMVTHLTSPLTLTVIGCLKNIIVTYGGMFIGGDYVYSLVNFIGINVSVAASLVYSFLKYKEQVQNSKERSSTTV